MPHLTRQQLAARRAHRRHHDRRRQRRAVLSAIIPALVVGLIAAALALTGGTSSEAAPPAVEAPVPSPALGSGARPPDIVVARSEGVELRLPVDPKRVTAAAFHPIGDPLARALEATGALEIEQVPRGDRAGPETAALDVGAPAGTTVFAPVDGVIAGVADYTVSGRVQGYEVTVEPAGVRGLMVRVTHLDPPVVGDRPDVGESVSAGVTAIGRVRDFSTVAEQELARFTADSGNHVHMELIRTGAETAP